MLIGIYILLRILGLLALAAALIVVMGFYALGRLLALIVEVIRY